MVGSAGAFSVRMRPVLHVTNGDAVVPDIAAATGEEPGRILPWRDVLHDGPVPAGLGAPELARVRAAHLAGRGWGEEGEILAELLERDARLDQADRNDEIVLWFEDDLFDQLQLAQVSDRLTGRPGPLTIVRMPHDRRHGLGAEFRSRVPYRADRAPFATLRSDDPRGWRRLTEIARLAEELPDRLSGLSRLEREIVEALLAGPLEPGELFAEVARREQPPWVADAVLCAVADGLEPLVHRNGAGYELTAEGRAVIAGDARWETPERWLGGVRLGPGRTRWAWDAEAHEVIRLG
jgi:hypothetical protein